MSSTPMIDRVLNAEHSGYELHMNFTAYDCAALVEEMRAMIAKHVDVERKWEAAHEAVSTERYNWQQRAIAAEDKLDALEAQSPTPPRRLREYKGVTYQDGNWWKIAGDGLPASYEFAAELISMNYPTFTDADHAALLALRDDPWEPVETLESIMQEFAQEWTVSDDNELDELLSRFCARLRAHLSPPLTAAECVRRLLDLGAQPTYSADGQKAIVLPARTEVSP